MLAIAVSTPAVAYADAPGPTDFESRIVGIEPSVEGLQVSVIGGDSFLQLEVQPGTAVSVPGYRGEPFVEFDADGTVRENRASPTYFESQSKRGGDAAPAGVTADTSPAWVVVADDGTYAWHDHRMHWMGGTPPADRGDVVQTGVVPLVVDGVNVEVQVATTWLASASPLPAVLGAVLGLAAAVWKRREWTLFGAAGLACVVGIVQYRSVPAVTGPSVLAWSLPATALIAAGVAVVARRSMWWRLGGQLVAGVELLAWAVQRRSVVSAALLPTEAPYWLDRAATGVAAGVGVVLVGLGLARAVEVVTRPPAAAG